MEGSLLTIFYLEKFLLSITLLFGFMTARTKMDLLTENFEFWNLLFF